MRSISEVVARFKQRWTEELSPAAIAQAARESGMTWNNSMLQPVITIQIFFLQILHGNTACEHLPHLAGFSFTAAAYCKARARISLEALRILLRRCVDQLQQETFDTGRWLGHRVFHIDGSSFSMPDTPALQAHFGQPSGQRQGCGFPTAHWLVQMHAATGMIINMLARPLRTHEMSGVTELHPELQAGDLLVADRGFCSYAHLALLRQCGAHGLMRVHQRTIVSFTPGRPHATPGKHKGRKGLPRSRWLARFDATDQLVEWLKPEKPPQWMSAQQYAALPDTLVVRELQYKILPKGFRTNAITLVTTLLDPQRYAAEQLAEQYRQRWEIETNFGYLKTTMKMDVLKCRTVEGVLRELHVFALIYNLVRQVMLQAARNQNVDVNRISFVDAVRWLQNARPGDELPQLVVNPRRPNRQEPRVRKRRPKQYPLMTKPRRQLQKELATQ